MAPASMKRPTNELRTIVMKTFGSTTGGTFRPRLAYPRAPAANHDRHRARPPRACAPAATPPPGRARAGSAAAAGGGGPRGSGRRQGRRRSSASAPSRPQGLARMQQPLVAVDRDRRRPCGYEDEHVALDVRMLRRAGARRPGEHRRVQVLRRLAPERAAVAPEPCRGRRQLGRCEPLDEREEPSLLEPHMRLEELPELAHRDALTVRALEPRRERAQTLMLEQRLHDERTRLLVVDDEREELFLLLAEVRHRGRLEEPFELLAHRRRLADSGRAAQPACLHERVLVVVGERDQSRMALHGLKLPPARRAEQPGIRTLRRYRQPYPATAPPAGRRRARASSRR